MEAQNSTQSAPTERDAFMGKLHEFHRKLGTPLKRIPMLGGRELDVYHLFHKVQSFGGSKVVSERRLWGEVARSFNLPSSVTSASYAVRQHYINWMSQIVRLLERYEYYLQDPITNDPLNTLLTIPRPQPPPPVKTLPWRPLTPIPQVTPIKQPTPSKDSLDYGRLILSLLSGYPNEVDFSFNVLTILSHEGRLELTSQLLAVLLAHVGLFSEDDPGLEEVYRESWYSHSDTDFIQFWELTVPEWIFVPLLNQPFSRASYVSSLFHPYTLPPPECVERLRVTQLANIIRNISFSESQAKQLASDRTVGRFLLLCAHNSVPTICSLSLDTLAHLAPYTTLTPHTPHTPHTSELLLGMVHEYIQSNDRTQVLRGVEIFGELSWSPANLSLLLTTPTSVYQRLFKLLLLPDALILLGCLETLYSLTFSSYELACRVLAVDKSLQVLVSLLIIKTEDLGKDVLKNVKIFEKKVVSQSNVSLNPVSVSGIKTKPSISSFVKNRASTTPVIQSGKLPAKSQSQISSSPLAKALSSGNGQSFIPVLTVQQLQELLTKSVQGLPKSLSTTTTIGSVKSNTPVDVKSTTAVTKQSTKVSTVSKATSQSSVVAISTAQGSKVSVSPLPNQSMAILDTLLGSSYSKVESGGSQFTKQWLSSMYEECSGAYLSPLEMYSSYLKFCSELKGQVKLVTLADFNSTIKKVFPNSLATKIAVGSTTVYMVAGLVKKTTPNSGSRDIVTKPINIEAIRGPTSTIGLAKSTKTSLTSLSPTTSTPITASGVTQKTIPVAKIISGTTPSLKSAVQRSESRPASPLTVARRALEMPAVESKGQPNPALKAILSFDTNEKPSEVKVQQQSTHRQENDTDPPAAKKVCVEDVRPLKSDLSNNVPKMVNGSMAENPLNTLIKGSKSLTPSEPSIHSIPMNHEGPISTNNLPCSKSLTRTSIQSSALPLYQSATAGSDLSSVSSSSLRSSVSTDSTGGRSQGSNPTDHANTKMTTTVLPRHEHCVTNRSKSVESSLPTSIVKSTQYRSKSVDYDLPNESSQVNRATSPLVFKQSHSNNNPCSPLSSTESSPCENNERSLSTVTKTITQNSLQKIITLNNTKTALAVTNSSRSNSIERDNVSILSVTAQPQSRASSPGTAMTASPLPLTKQPSSSQSSSASNSTPFQVSPLPVATSTHVTTTGSGIGRANGGSEKPGLSMSTAISMATVAMVMTSSVVTPQTSTVLSDKTPVTNPIGSNSPNASSLSVSSKDAALSSNSSVSGTRPICLWAGCTSVRHNWAELFHHVVNTHLNQPQPYPLTCQWVGCSNTSRRMRPSLLAHIQSHHCSPEVPPSPPNIAKTLLKIKHSPPFTEDDESYLSKSVHLTAALVLRNLLRALPEATLRLVPHEWGLIQVACSDSEASTVVAECLHLMYEQQLS